MYSFAARARLQSDAFPLAVSNIFEKDRKTCEQVVDLTRLCKVGEGPAKKGATQIALLLV
jgi:hypothetical protein